MIIKTNDSRPHVTAVRSVLEEEEADISLLWECFLPLCKHNTCKNVG